MRTNTDTDSLVDIRDICVDPSLPKRERIMEYVRQIRDPCHFKCGKFTVKASFAESGPSIEDCLRSILS